MGKGRQFSLYKADKDKTCFLGFAHAGKAWVRGWGKPGMELHASLWRPKFVSCIACVGVCIYGGGCEFS